MVDIAQLQDTLANEAGSNAQATELLIRIHAALSKAAGVAQGVAVANLSSDNVDRMRALGDRIAALPDPAAPDLAPLELYSNWAELEAIAVDTARYANEIDSQVTWADVGGTIKTGLAATGAAVKATAQWTAIAILLAVVGLVVVLYVLERGGGKASI